MDKTSKNYEYSREEKDALPEITCPYKFYYFYTAPVTKFYSYTVSENVTFLHVIVI